MRRYFVIAVSNDQAVVARLTAQGAVKTTVGPLVQLVARIKALNTERPETNRIPVTLHPLWLTEGEETKIPGPVYQAIKEHNDVSPENTLFVKHLSLDRLLADSKEDPLNKNLRSFIGVLKRLDGAAQKAIRNLEAKALLADKSVAITKPPADDALGRKKGKRKAKASETK